VSGYRRFVSEGAGDPGIIAWNFIQRFVRLRLVGIEALKFQHTARSTHSVFKLIGSFVDYFVLPDLGSGAPQERIVLIQHFLDVLGVGFQVFDENLIGDNSVGYQRVNIGARIER